MTSTNRRRGDRPESRLVRASTFAILAVLAMVGAAPAAQAQTAESRGFLTVNGGILAAGADLAARGTFGGPLFGPQDASLEADHPAATDILFDVGGGVRVWRNLAVGASVSRASREADVAVSGQLPHPFHFDRQRRVSGTARGLARTETALHLHVQYLIPVSSSFTVTLSAGPTRFNVMQDLVMRLDFEQEYPYDSASFAGASTQLQSASTFGVHVGADAAFHVSSAIGVGATVRFSRGTVDFEAPAGGANESTAGGHETSGGLRIRF